MAILINRTNHAIFFGSTMLVPARPTEVVGKLTDIKKQYPGIASAMTKGLIESVTAKAAAEALSELASKTLEEIQAYAKEKGIDLTGKTTKEEMLAAVSGV